MQIRHLKAKKPDGWNQLIVKADQGRRLFIDPESCEVQDKGLTKITILEGPENRHKGVKNGVPQANAT